MTATEPEDEDPPPTPFWDLLGYRFVKAEMWAAMEAETARRMAEYDKPQRGKPKTPEAAARLKAGRAKGKTMNKKLRDTLDKAKEIPCH